MSKAVPGTVQKRRSVRAVLRSMVLEYFGNNPSIFGWIRRGYVGLGFGEKNETDYLFDLSRKTKEVSVLQIGANDGKRHDSLRPFLVKYAWRGLLLEPLPDIFADLQQTYAGCGNVTPVNAALADQDGELPFYRVKPGPNVPDNCHELGSFYREVVLKHAAMFPGVELSVVMEPITAYSFDSLVKTFDIRKIDAMVIDTEGYDFEILKMIDFERFRPPLVIYEHMHLNETDRAAATEQLRTLGYSVHRMVKGGDANTAAVLKRS